MRKTFYSFVALFLFITGITAKTITSDVAQTVAATFYKQNGGVAVQTLSLAHTATAPSGEAVYFAYNINPVGKTSNGVNAGDGFVIVAADDALYPIIGYSNKGQYVVPDPSSNAGYWMESRKNEIIADRALQVQATAEISGLWTAYTTGQVISKRTTGSVSPLVQTTWDQPAPYNTLCPGGSVTGCVATAMAQIMRFWSYPPKGTGSSSYNSSYGNLTANYGSTTYHWTNMPYTGVTTNNDVDTLMYDCGVSVDMEYSPSGSGAWVTTYDDPSVCAQISYSKYFGYNANTIKGLQRFNYTDANWTTTIETDLNAGRPVQYVGYDPNYGGHTWVCDGYDANNNMHMNWGWSGQDNAYYSINTLNPSGYNFADGHEVLVGIEPPAAVALDAGVLAVASPSGTTCNSSVTPVVSVENFGSSVLTSCTINYYYDSNTPTTYHWTGSLITGQSTNVTLPAMSVTNGTHSFTSYTTKPNNGTDGNSANDESTGSFTIAYTGIAMPLTAGFEGSTFLPTGWSIWNPDGDATWQIVTTVAHTGTNCIGMNNCDGDGSNDMTGTRDRFITMPYDFTGKANSMLSFDVAYATVTSGGSVFPDTLVVYYSTNCGASWTQCYMKGGATLATAPTYNADEDYGCWSPSSSQWRTDVVNLGNLTGQPSVMLAFENRSGYGGWMFIDNINLTGTTITGITAIPEVQPLHIYPNPATNAFTVEGSATDAKVHYALFNIIGEELRAGDVATDGSHFSYSIDATNLTSGMYFLRVNDNEHSWTSKVEVR